MWDSTRPFQSTPQENAAAAAAAAEGGVVQDRGGSGGGGGGGGGGGSGDLGAVAGGVVGVWRRAGRGVGRWPSSGPVILPDASRGDIGAN